MEQCSKKYSRVSPTTNICKGISKTYLTTNDVIYACVSLCECVSVYTANIHMYFAYLYQWAYVYLCNHHELVNNQVLILSIYKCTFNYMLLHDYFLNKNKQKKQGRLKRVG